MRKFIIVLVILFIAAIAYLGYAQISGGAVPTFGLPIGGEKAEVRHRVLAFFEDVKFKNSNGLRDFIEKGVTDQEFNSFLKTLGLSNDIDLNQMSIKQIETDKQAARARVVVHLTGQDLKNHLPMNTEKLIFLFRDTKWLIDVKSALRL